MERLAVTTVVYRPAADVYEFLSDFPRYARYSKYLESVGRMGEGPDGPRYALQFRWWLLTYTARSEVTAEEPPERIEFRLLGDFDASGRWEVTELDDLPPDAPVDASEGCEVAFVVEFAPETAHRGMLDLPALISLETVIDKARPLVEAEAKRVVERAVADLEGRERSVSLEVESGPVESTDGPAGDDDTG